jgi:hypothetical protein
MEQAKDINDVIESSWSFMSYGTLVRQYPYLHRYLLSNPRLVKSSWWCYRSRGSNVRPYVARNQLCREKS